MSHKTGKYNTNLSPFCHCEDLIKKPGTWWFFCEDCDAHHVWYCDESLFEEEEELFWHAGPTLCVHCHNKRYKIKPSGWLLNRWTEDSEDKQGTSDKENKTW